MASASGLADPTDGVMMIEWATWPQYPRATDVDGDLYVITPESVAATE
jgi:hypothetical protein